MFKLRRPLVQRDKTENEVVEQMIEKILKKNSYIPIDAQYLTNGSTITRRSLVQICSNTIQVELKFRTQPDRSLSKSRTAQLKAQPCIEVIIYRLVTSLSGKDFEIGHHVTATQIPQLNHLICHRRRRHVD